MILEACAERMIHVAVFADGIAEHAAVGVVRDAIEGLAGVDVVIGLIRGEVNTCAADVVVLGAPTMADQCVSTIRELNEAAIICCLGARCESEACRWLAAGADLVLDVHQSTDLARAVLRSAMLRAARVRVHQQVVVGDLVCDRIARRIRCGGSEIVLSPREWHLFNYLLEQKDRRATTGELQEAVFRAGEKASNAVPVYVGYLRRKLRRSQHIRIVTLRGYGYALTASDGAGSSSTKENIS